MNSTTGLGLDSLLHALLRHLVEEAGAVGGIVVSAAGAMLARHPPLGLQAPGVPEPAKLLRVMSGECWNEGARFLAPLTIGSRSVAALVLEMPDGKQLSAEAGARLLTHAGHTNLAWSPLPEDTDPESEALPPLHVLVAEDNEVNRKVAKAFLEHAGHAVAVCSDGALAVEAVREGEYDVVLMDIRMPGMDGVEATRAIRALPDRRRAGLPILALTANFTADEVDLYLAAGMNGVIRKPLRLGDIEAALAPIFSLPDDSADAKTAEQSPEDTAGTSPVLDPARVALLAEALPPAKLAELYASAKASIVETLAELRRHWADQDVAAAGKAAHRLAGVAANFGCTSLGELARMIEAGCKQGVLGRQYAQSLSELENNTLEALSKLHDEDTSGNSRF